MSSNSDIEWTDTTWNPVVGCTPVSPGCLNCYAATFSARGMHPNYVGLTVRKGKRAVFNGTVRTLPDKLEDPLHWKKPRRVFVNSMSDLFHEAVPFEFVNEVFAVMSMTPQHTYQILTKRPERMAKYMLLRMGRRPLPNVWLGTSVENQTTADERIPHLLRCPAAVRFLSCEPLLGPISFSVKCPPEYQPHIRHDRIGWVITGGESGPGARPCNVEWIRSIVLRCKAAQVPVFVKQLGAKPYDPSWHGNGTTTGSAMNLNDSKGGDPDEWSDDLRVREMPVANTAQAGGAVTR